MKTFKPTYRDRNGKTRKCAHWYLTFVDNRQIRRRLPAYSDKAATDRLGIQIQKVLNSNGVLDKDLQAWFVGLIPAVRDRLIKWHMVSSQRIIRHLDKTLAEHLEDFCASLFINASVRHAKQVKSQLKTILESCGFQQPGDIDGNTVERYLGSRLHNGEISQRTYNCYLGFVQHFCVWMKNEQRIPMNPVEHLQPVKVTKKMRVRRAITQADLIRLLEATWAAETRFGMTGKERWLLYVVACQTGMRAGDLRGLKVGDFDLNAPAVTAKASCSKNRKEKTLPLKPSTAAMLKDFFKAKLPTARAFGGTYKQLADKTAKMLREDLAEAGIEYVDDKGRIFDFHSLRKEAGTLLKQAGVNIKDAQTILRHSDLKLTANIYTETFSDDEADAVAKLPDFAKEKSVLSVA